MAFNIISVPKPIKMPSYSEEEDLQIFAKL